MNLYKANLYFNLTNGLDICDQTGTTVINIKAESTDEVTRIANKILATLNEDYYMKKALLKDNEENWNLGLLTAEEKAVKEQQIMSSSY